MSDVTIDARAFSKFARALKKTSPDIAKGLRVGLRAAGEIVAADARDRASSFSKRIPGSIRVRTGAGRVSVIAGGAKAPDAPVLEHGGREGQFRHPVFGNRSVWVSQQARPFLHPALAAKGEEARAAIAETVLETLRSLGGDY